MCNTGFSKCFGFMCPVYGSWSEFIVRVKLLWLEVQYGDTSIPVSLYFKFLKINF